MHGASSSHINHSVLSPKSRTRGIGRKDRATDWERDNTENVGTGANMEASSAHERVNYNVTQGVNQGHKRGDEN